MLKLFLFLKKRGRKGGENFLCMLGKLEEYNLPFAASSLNMGPKTTIFTNEIKYKQKSKNFLFCFSIKRI